MKRLILTILIFLALTGCGRREEPVPQHFTAFGGDAEITLDADALHLLEQLGTPLGYGETASCAFDGVQRTYRFRGICVETYEGESGEQILGFWFTDDTFTTEEGIRLGSTAEAVEAAYGARSGDTLTLTRGEEKMILSLKDGIVDSIRYTLI